MVTGRVTKNTFAAFSSTKADFLEVTMKLTEAAKVQRVHERPRPVEAQQLQQQVQQYQQHQHHHHQQSQQPQQPQHHHHHQHHHSHPQNQMPQYNGPTETALTPTGAAEWNSFIQSNPQIGQPAIQSRGASPALSQAPPPVMHERRDSFHQTPPQANPQHQQAAQLQQQPSVQRVAPTPVDTTTDSNAPAAPSRPSSRASNSSRRKPPTGRPRGRPRGSTRKKPLDGSTSGYEDGTEGEEGGPAKKRAKTTQVDKVNTNPFVTAPDSLRVAASTAGSLRSIRPAGMSNDGGPGGNHLQEIPRAATPIPKGPMSGPLPRGTNASFRRESSLNHEVRQPLQDERQLVSFHSQEDGRSPESTAPTPAFSDDNPTDIGSSPPVPRRPSLAPSSLAPSSPILPPMPLPNQSMDGPAEHHHIEDLFGDEGAQLPPLPKESILPQPRKLAPRPRRESHAIPIQVFRMEDGPGGQDMVPIDSWNTPRTTSAALLTSDAVTSGAAVATKPIKARAAPRKSRAVPPPTPPQTTDAIEKPVSPIKPTDTSEQSSKDHVPLSFIQPRPSPTLEAALHQSTPEHAGSEFTPSVTEIHSVGQLVMTTDDQGAAFIQGSIEPVRSVDVQSPNRSEREPTQPKRAQTSQVESRKLVRSQSAHTGLELPRPDPSKPPRPSSLPLCLPLPQAPGIELRDPKAPALRRTTSEASALEPLTATLANPTLGLPRPASSSATGENAAETISSGPLSTKMPSLALPKPCPPSEACSTPSFSEDGGKANKNVVKKHAIKQRLQTAISNGELPPYCSNCGAIETPTWRKTWVQDRDGPPEKMELSAKPGMITAVEVRKYDEDTNEPIQHRVIKKNLGREEDQSQWVCQLLCNPCGIWLAKSLCQRPSDRWDKDASRLAQGQKKRERGQGQTGNRSRSKRARTKSDVQAGSFSEAFLPTDVPTDLPMDVPTDYFDLTGPCSPKPNEEDLVRAATAPALEANNSMEIGSAHSSRSRGSGTVKSPIALEEDETMSTTRRLLFPSPRKDGSPKVLGEVNINIVQTSDDCHQPKGLAAEAEAGKENNTVGYRAHEETVAEADDLDALFGGSDPPQPSTPVSNSKRAGLPPAFKTPTQATPNHRPVTRSVSQSKRALTFLEPSQEAQKTPSKTPRSSLNPPQTPTSRRRSPRNHDDNAFGESQWDTPVSRAISKMLSNDPIFSDPSFGVETFSDDMGFSDLPPMDESQGMVTTGHDWFSTDSIVPNRTPRSYKYFDYEGSAEVVDKWEESVKQKDQVQE